MKAWFEAGKFALIDDLALRPKPGETSLALYSTSEHAISYCLVDETDNKWILKKFFAEYEPEFGYLETIRDLVPRVPGFESGFDRRVLNHSSLSTSGYYNEELQLWLHGAILVPQVSAPTWAALTDSIMAGGHELSRLVRLLTCEKLSNLVGRLESSGLAHRDLSAQTVLIDPVNLEVHAIEWDTLYHSSLAPQPNSTSCTPGYIAPFMKPGTDATWRPHSDRFALAILNTEILLMKADAQRAAHGGLLEQQDLYNLAGQTLSRVRNALQQAFPDAVKLLEQSLTASNFDQCPAPSDWLTFINRELNNDANQSWDEWKPPAEESQSRSVFERPRTPGFVSVNESAFVKINWQAFAGLPPDSRHR